MTTRSRTPPPVTPRSRRVTSAAPATDDRGARPASPACSERWGCGGPCRDPTPNRCKVFAMQFEVEIYRNETGEWVATAVQYNVTVKGRTEPDTLAQLMDALALHF